MKTYFFIVLVAITFSAYSRQSGSAIDLRDSDARLRDFVNEVKFNKNGSILYDTVFKDYEKVFYVSKSELKNKIKVDSLFGLAKYFLVDAIKGGYKRIVITITKKGIFGLYRKRIFYCDKLFEELTGKKLYRH